MLKLKTLSGWLRLWIVTSVIFFMAIIVLCYSTRPTIQDIFNEWSGRLIEFLVNNDPALSKYKPWELAQLYSDIPPENLVEKINSKYISNHLNLKRQVDDINSSFKTKINSMHNQLILHYLKGIFIWLVSTITLYIAGAAIGWVYRGFKSSNKKT